MNIWLTSKKGFLGEELFPRLLKKYNVFATDRLAVDILDSSQVDNFIRSNKIDIVVHNAIRGGRRIKKDGPEVAYENIFMFENLVKNSSKVKKIINFDSAACFDRRQDIHNFKESDLGRYIPIDYYGFSKMNIALRSLSVHNSFNLRIFNCFGPLETPDRMTKANIIRYINNENLIIHKNKFMDIFYIDDLFKVLELYIEKENIPKDLNLVYEQKYTLLDIANIINKLDVKKSKIIINDTQIDNSYTGDYSLIKSLNFNFVGVEYGIHQMYETIKMEKKNV